MTTTNSASEQRLKLFGKWFITPIFSIGSGIITTVAVSSLSIIANLALPWSMLILAFVFLSESAISIYLYKNSVPETLVAIFIKGILKDLSPIKKVILTLGIFSALGGGFALCALTYTSGIVAISAVLGIFSLAFPALVFTLAAGLAIVAFIAFSSLLIKWIASAIKTNIHVQALNFFKNIFTRDALKPLTQQILEGFFKITFTFAILAISIIGTIATLGTMRKGLIEFLSLIPNANILAVKIASGIIAYGLMGVARLPLVLQSVCSVFSLFGEIVGRKLFYIGCEIGSKIGIYIPPATNLKKINTSKKECSYQDIGISLLKTSAVVIHAVSFGALAKSGGGKVISELMTDLNFPFDATTMDTIGQSAAMTSGSIMAGGIGTFSLFADSFKNPPSSQPKPSTSMKLLLAIQ